MRSILVAIPLLLCSALHVAQAQSYTFKTSKAPMNGSTIFWAVDKGNAVLSEVTSPSGSAVCTLIMGATKTVISDPSGTTTQCYGISDTGTVVGYYINAAQSAVGFTYVGGVYKDYLAPGSNAAMGGTQLNAISSKGVIAGAYTDASGYSRIFTLKGTVYHAVTIGNADYLLAVGVNDAGQIVAQSFDANNNILANYLVQGSSTTTLSYPGSSRTIMHAINSGGIVVGHYTDSAGTIHGFTYNSSTSTYSAPIDAPGGSTLLIGINAEGDVVGASPSANGQVYVGLRGTPVK